MKQRPDKEEFLHLIEGNRKIIFKICNFYCQNKSDREDLAQEIIYQLWKSGNSFNPDYKFSTWMYRVALNVAISFYHWQEKTKRIVSGTDKLINIEDKSESNSEDEGKMRLLTTYINDLKELDRALMILYLESKTYEEIADILGITTTNVATKVNRIKERMKQKFLNTK
jgi:RNA polymerase sigma-70 factor, ECF subfamily